MQTLARQPDLRGLLGGRALVAIARTDEAIGAPALLAEEAAGVRRAVDSRRLEFATGRGLARSLLRTLGAPDGPIVRNDTGEPRWPAGFTGSISHARGLCIAAIGRAELASSIGVDLEPDEPLEADLFDSLVTREEQVALGALSPLEHGRRARLHFCCKEAIFKALFPRARRWVDFLDVVVSIDGSGSFRASAALPEDPDAALIHSLRGEWRVSNGWILGAAWLPPLASTPGLADDRLARATKAGRQEK